MYLGEFLTNGVYYFLLETGFWRKNVGIFKKIPYQMQIPNL